MVKFDKEKIAVFLLKKSESARLDAMIDVIEFLIDSDILRYRKKDDDPEFGCDEDIYWEFCGESIFGKDE